jgi:hypothetical protein
LLGAPETGASVNLVSRIGNRVNAHDGPRGG